MSVISRLLFTRKARRNAVVGLLALMISVGVFGCDEEPEDDETQQAQEQLQQDDEAQQQDQQQDEQAAELEVDGDPLQLDEDIDPGTFHEYSAPAMYNMLLMSPFLVAMGGQMAMDPEAGAGDQECPQIDEDADGTTEIIGDCTDDDGNEWVGSATITELGESYALPAPQLGADEGEDDSEYHLGEMTSDLQVHGSETCQTDEGIEIETTDGLVGDIEVDELGDGEYEFEIDFEFTDYEIDHDACEATHDTVVYRYSGAVELQDADGEMAKAHQWRGEGDLSSEEHGAFRAETTDQRFDIDECGTQPLSGTTTISAEGSELEYRYNGEEDCDPDATADWYLDGEHQGEVSGVHCSSTGPAGGAAAALLMILALAAVRRGSLQPAG